MPRPVPRRVQHLRCSARRYCRAMAAGPDVDGDGSVRCGRVAMNRNDLGTPGADGLGEGIRGRGTCFAQPTAQRDHQTPIWTATASRKSSSITGRAVRPAGRGLGGGRRQPHMIGQRATATAMPSATSTATDERTSSAEAVGTNGPRAIYTPNLGSFTPKRPRSILYPFIVTKLTDGRNDIANLGGRAAEHLVEQEHPETRRTTT